MTPHETIPKGTKVSPIDMLYTLIFYFYFYFFKENTCHLNESSLATRHVIATKSMY